MATGVPSREEPNLYELSGDGMEITYSTSSFAGLPQFSYRDAQSDVASSGDEIRVVESEIGRQVTVTLDEVPDLHTVTVTLLVPTINLEGRESSFATVAILTTARTSIGGPGLVQGAVQSYTVVALEGTARLVDF